MNPPYPTTAQANYSLVVLLVAYVLSFVDRQILSLLVGPIRQDLAISDFQMSLLQGMAFAIFYAILGLPIGRLADRRRRTTIIAAGVFLWSAMTAACGLAKTFGMLFLARVGVGVGEATLSPAAYSILSDSFRPERLARATSIFSMGVTIGSGMAYIIGGSVADAVSNAQTVSLPLIGACKPWQLAFFIVGLPGLAIGLWVLSITEPARQGVIATAPGDDGGMRINDVLGFLWQRRRGYGPLFLGVSLLSILGYGLLSWYPTFLIRTYAMPVGEVGMKFGLIYLVFGTAGAMGGALLSERLARQGHRDANLRVIMLVCMALVVPAAIGPLMPSAALALVVAAPTVFLMNAFFGVSIAALQLMTPNQMRAVVSALFLLINNLVGLGFGASAVAFFTDFVFGNDLSLRYSLVWVAVIVCPLACFTVWRGLKPYRSALNEAAAWA